VPLVQSLLSKRGLRRELLSMRTIHRALAVVLLAMPALGPAQSPCESKCNQQASECLRRCAGDPKEAAKAENAKKLMACLQTCEAEAKPCRESCRK
jgi:hypothetical protein